MLVGGCPSPSLFFPSHIKISDLFNLCTFRILARCTKAAQCSVHEGLIAVSGGGLEVVVVDESNESIKGVGDLSGEEEDHGEVSEHAERVEDEHKDVVGAEDGPASEEDVEEDAADFVVGPGLLLFVVDEKDEEVEKDWSNAEGDDGSNGEYAKINLVKDASGDGEASGGDGEGEGELLEGFSGHGSSLVHIRYGIVLKLILYNLAKAVY